ncbi:MAG: hypothetical protein H7039_04885 [Bryobacteraceae bacterium]|nr:hypothetical protein [Bryobacteraceae bacterium]
MTQPLFAPEPQFSGPELYQPAQLDRQPQTALLDELTALRQRVHDLDASLPMLLSEARASAFQEGESAGYDKAASASRIIVEKLSAAIHDIAGYRSKIREESEAELVALSIAIARRILHREISIDTDAIQGVVRAALEKVQAREITEIRLYPGHEDAVRKCLTELHTGGVQIIADPAMSPGDLVIETKRGNVEASIESQLKEIERGFADRIRR